MHLYKIHVWGQIKMKHNLLKKGMVLGIIMLFVGASIIPSIGGDREETDERSNRSDPFVVRIINESMLKKVFLIGTITDVNEGEDFTTFNAKRLLSLSFRSFDREVYHSSEQIIISNDHRGYVGQRFIIGRFETYIIPDVEYTIEGLEPPPYHWNIPEGSCGEACLWSVLHYYGINVTQEEINEAGGSPGRGLRWCELYDALDYFGIDYNDLSGFVYTKDHYEKHLQENIVDNVKKGHALLISVKIYPTFHPLWCRDHFILITGYTNTDKLIYNSFTERGSIPISKLLNKRWGYSLINECDGVWCLEFTLT